MTSRKSFSQKERVRLFTLNKGVCYLCNGKIDAGQAWEIEHVIPWALTRDDSDDNLRLAHVKCHKAKTAKDAGDLKKVRNVQAAHTGAKAKSKTPLPFGRGSRLKRRLNGTIVERN